MVSIVAEVKDVLKLPELLLYSCPKRIKIN